MPQISLLFDNGDSVRQDVKCTQCTLCNNPRLKSNCVDGIGPHNAKIMVVLPFPTSEDDQNNSPATGRSGRILRELLLDAGFDPTDIFFTNAVRCCTFDTKLNDKFYNKCVYHLKQEVNKINPEAIIAIGGVAFTWLTGQQSVNKFRKHSLQFLPKKDIPVYAVFTPSSVMYGDTEEKVKKRKEIIEDLTFIYNKLQAGTLRVTDFDDTDYKMARSMDEVKEFIEEMKEAEYIAVDIETSDLFPEEGQFPMAFGFSTKEKHGRAIPLYAYGTTTLYYWTDEEVNEIFDLLRPVLLTKPLFGHNWLQFDQKWLKHFFGVDRTNVIFDTMLAHYLVDEEKGTHGLEQLAVRYTKMRAWKSTFTKRDTIGLCQYLCKDVDATFRVKDPIENELTDKQKHLLHDLLIPLGHELMEMEYEGILPQMKNLEALQTLIDNRIAEEMRKLKAMPEVKAFELNENTSLNPNKAGHLRVIMEEYLKLEPIIKTAGGKFSTGKETLEAYKDNPFIAGIQQVRGLYKLKGTFIDGMLSRIKKDGKIHTSYLIHGTVTGRLASRDPNLQNIPREDTAGKVISDGSLVKSCFSVEDGYVMLGMDFSQAELRTLAMYTKDEALIEMFRQGLDAHTATAAKAYGIEIEKVTKAQRTSAKNINFGVVYGMSEMSLIHKFVTAGNTKEEAKRFLELHKQEFWRVWEWMEEEVLGVKKLGYQETFFGRRRRYNYVDESSKRQIYNYKIQGTASEFTLYTLIRTAKMLRKLKLDAKLILTVHDSITYKVRIDQFWEVARIVKHIAENLNFPFMNVPLKADMEVGRNWGKMKKIDPNNERFIED